MQRSPIHILVVLVPSLVKVCMKAYVFWYNGSNWIRLDQIGPNWIKLDQIGSNWIKLDQIGSNWIKLVKTGKKHGLSNMVLMDMVLMDMVLTDMVLTETVLMDTVLTNTVLTDTVLTDMYWYGINFILKLSTHGLVLSKNMKTKMLAVLNWFSIQFSMIFIKCLKNSILLSGPNRTSERPSYLFSLNLGFI
jgi:hypothetical protein